MCCHAIPIPVAWMYRFVVKGWPKRAGPLFFMPDYFDQIAAPVPADNVTFKVVVTPTYCKAWFKYPGRRAEVADAFYSAAVPEDRAAVTAHVNDVLRELLHRLGVHDLPTVPRL